MAEQETIFEVDGKGIALWTLNRPDKFNAISSEMLLEIFPRILQQIKQDDDIKVVIITGAGKAFCSGADVSERLSKLAEGKLLLHRHDVLEPVGYFTTFFPDLPKPIIAAINGVCAGVGFSMALLCDIRIASEKARFSSVFVKRGLMPDGCLTFSLPTVVGIPRALELMMTGRVIGAEEADRIGLVNKVVPHEKLMEEAYAFAEELIQVAPIALSFTKRAVWNLMRERFYQNIQFESWGQTICKLTKDFKEGVAAFEQKRAPQFRGIKGEFD